MIHGPEQSLWAEVLLRQVDDALQGPGSSVPKDQRIPTIQSARSYLTTSSRQLDELCILAGVEMDGLIKAMRAKIANAPAPEELLAKRKRSRASMSRVATKPKAKRIKPGDRLILIAGETRTMQEWADRYGLTLAQITSRLNQGWTVERAVTQPTGQRNRDWGSTGGTSNFGAFKGTGGGRSAQDSPKIDFSDRKAS